MARQEEYCSNVPFLLCYGWQQSLFLHWGGDAVNVGPHSLSESNCVSNFESVQLHYQHVKL